jgi:uncharacterized protein YjhX (UPF0386 family)
MIVAPCKDCPNRQAPKLCESTCEIWQEYKKKKIVESQKVYDAKKTSFDIKRRKRL